MEFQDIDQASHSANIYNDCSDHFWIQVTKFLPEKAAEVPHVILALSKVMFGEGCSCEWSYFTCRI